MSTKLHNHAMTELITPQDIVKIVHKKGMKACLEGVAKYIWADYLRWEEFDKSRRVAKYVENGVMELMPIADQKNYAFKYVNCHPHNPALGLSTVIAFGALADAATGMPLTISELTLTTAFRTAATSVLAARYLARKNSHSMSIIGNGSQAEFQVLAFHYLLGIEEIHLYDKDRKVSEKLVRNLAHTGMKFVIANDVGSAVKGTDIITTVTAEYARAHIITPDMIEPGMHINAVGGDSPGKTELHPDILPKTSVFVEFEEQTRIEGELQNVAKDFPVTHLWEVFSEARPGRKQESEVTLFDSVGFALEDYSALKFMRDAACELGLLQHISLVPDLADPKDLFAYLGGDAIIAVQEYKTDCADKIPVSIASV